MLHQPQIRSNMFSNVQVVLVNELQPSHQLTWQYCMIAKSHKHIKHATQKGCCCMTLQRPEPLESNYQENNGRNKRYIEQKEEISVAQRSM
jgi:hypothetical protein